MRIFYRREGPGKFISANYLQKVFERALRRAGLPMAFSKGFSPRPLISFGPSPGVGIPGENELMELVLLEKVDLEIVKNNVNSFLPEGMLISDCRYMEEGRPAGLPVKAAYRIRKTHPIPETLPEGWRVVRDEGSIIEVEIEINCVKTRTLDEIFGLENIIIRKLIF